MKKLRFYIINIFVFLISFDALAQECVVLLHGLGRRSFSLNKIENALKNEGFKTLSIDYESRLLGVEYISKNLIYPKILDLDHNCNCSKIHFVGYSLGGIITRYIIKNNKFDNLGRVVLIATPNSGSEYASVIKKYDFVKYFLGQTIEDLSKDSVIMRSIPEEVNYETGVISANFTLNFLSRFFILKDECDGTVTVESTKIRGMKDHIIIPSTHSLIIFNQKAIDNVVSFIKNGFFDKENDVMPF